MSPAQVASKSIVSQPEPEAHESDECLSSLVFLNAKGHDSHD